ncbi:MAG: sulfatase-like hydrolase/transferase [Candidatus Lokiarchaeota archaeon]|nr:sulfatase-like hydrolase/transferase [Candidatus Lokiarchaeota archaeon]
MAQQPARPNIVLIMVESWDGRVLGCLGDPALKKVTPNIDRFAARGVLFKNHYTPQPVCCPARANMWSGQYTFNCKSWSNHKGLEPGTPILRDVLTREGGYILATRKKGGAKGRANDIGIGKHDYISGGHSQQNRITDWTCAANIQLPSYLQPAPRVKESDAQKFHVEDWIRCAKARNFLKKQAKRQKKGKGEPFFLYLSLTTPHPAFKTTRHWLSKVDQDAVSVPPKDPEPLHPVLEYQRISKAWAHGLDPASVKRTRAIYYAMVAETDGLIGEVLDEIEGLGLLETTHVIITADHGENNMEHDMFYKMNMYDSASRVPLIVAGPGTRQGVVVEDFVSLVDLYPTILDLAGIPKERATSRLDGESFLPLLKGTPGWSRDYAFSMYTGTAANTSMFMLRTGRWKYVAYPGFEPQLFDLAADPDEITNLAKGEPGVVKELDAKLRGVCDYERVHAEWQAWCKASFRAYRDKLKGRTIPLFEYGAKNPRATYEDVIANTYKGWTPAHAKQIEQWLDS